MKTIGSESKSRLVKNIVTSTQTMEGAGFSVRRPFPTATLSYVDPFLLLDHMEPVELPPGKAKGAPDHPHRGFETVTYLLEGQMQHRDSAGNHGLLSPGDVQWMTAGAGVVHSEMPGEELLEKGGRLHGFQIWVNLPARDKMMKPRYQDIPSAKIPVLVSDDGLAQVKIIAGESMGAKAVIDTRTPIMYLHFTIKPNGKITQKIPSGFNVMAYVIKGSGRFGENEIEASPEQLVVFNETGESINIHASKDEELSVLVLGGLPLNEPVARYGPFVMNTKEEILQAVNDYQSGRMGEISAKAN
ncbi:MAG: pirin family protein [Candidatus Obscuribacterales bacterium]|nr:pirin family protein [Candidatus Obscuribacterales bacterium]